LDYCPTEVREDGGPLDKLNYVSMILVAAFSALPKYPNLMRITPARFSRLVEGDIKLVKCFENELKKPLEQLEKELEEGAHLDNMVCLPSDLEIGAGY